FRRLPAEKMHDKARQCGTEVAIRRVAAELEEMTERSMFPDRDRDAFQEIDEIGRLMKSMGKRCEPALAILAAERFDVFERRRAHRIEYASDVRDHNVGAPVRECRGENPRDFLIERIAVTQDELQ